MTCAQIADVVGEILEEESPGPRAIRKLVTDLETMGLVETWVDRIDSGGREKKVETTFEPRWVREVLKTQAGEAE